MSARFPSLFLLFALSPAAAALGAEQDTPPPTSYQNVMRAQYAARVPAMPMRPEEAQRIYDAHLRAIGRPIKDSSLDTGESAGTSSR